MKAFVALAAVLGVFEFFQVLAYSIIVVRHFRSKHIEVTEKDKRREMMQEPIPEEEKKPQREKLSITEPHDDTSYALLLNGTLVLSLL